MSLLHTLEHLPFPFRLRAERRQLTFKRPARTSRGDLASRTLWLVHAETADGRQGIGECCPIPGLSPENPQTVEAKLQAACAHTQARQGLAPEAFLQSPAIRFALESALAGLLRPQPHAPVWDTPVGRGEQGIEIHHLIWMDSAAAMLQRMEEGIAAGFRCLKLKVGALPFAEEASMLREAHARFPHAEIRVDANGAFPPQEALQRLETLVDCGVSLIEQPIRPGQPAEMAELIRRSPLPIALDEELIPAQTRAQRRRLLEQLRPAAIVIKPTLHGGLSGAEDWAATAAGLNIRSWVNSAMESQVGLSMLTEWCGAHAPNTLHGLGTGRLYTCDDPRRTILRANSLYLCAAN